MIRKDQLTQDGSASSTAWRGMLGIAVIALVYFGVARFSLSFTFEPEGIAAICPSSGIILSALLLTRRNIRPYLIAVLFFTDLAAEILAGIPPVLSLVYSAATLGDGVLGAWLYRRFVGELPTFRQVRQVIGFLVLCILLSNALAAAVAALAAAIFLKVPFWSAWLWWWSSDGVGSLLVTPLIISLAFAIKTRFAEFKKGRFIEGAVLFLLMAFSSNYAFSHLLSEGWFLLLMNVLVFPFLIWASLRFGVLGAAATSVILTAIILQYAIEGTFAQLGVDSNLKAIIIAQVYIAMISIPSILLAALITERKQAEEELRESEDKFKYVFDYSIVGISITLLSGEINVNKAFCDMLGYSQEELRHQRWQDITHPDDVELTQREVDSLLSGEKKSTRFDKRFIHKSGGVVWVNLSSSVRQDKTGKPLYLVTALNDITKPKQQEAEILAAQAKTKQMLEEANQSRRALLGVVEDQRLAEQALKTSEKRFRDVTEYAQEWIWEVDAEGKYVYASGVIEEILGYTPEEILQKHFYDLFHPDDRESLKSGALAAFAAKQPFRDFINRNVHKNGQTVWFATSGLPLLDDKGNLLGYRGADADITESKRAEAERQSLLEILQGVAATRSLQELLELIHQSLAKVIYAENFFVVFFNRSSGLFEEVFAVDKYDEAMPPSKLDRSITSYVFRTGEPLLLTTAKLEELVAWGEVDLVGTKPAIWMGAPLKTPDQTIGVIVVQNYEDADCYSERDLEFLASVAMQVALVIDRKRAEVKLEDSLSLQIATLESTTDGILVVDQNGKISSFNHRFMELWGIPQSILDTRDDNQALGFVLEQLITPEDFIRKVKELYAQPEAESYDMLKFKDGRTFERYSRPQKIGATFVGRVWSFRDVTERKRAEEEITKQIEELQRWNSATLGREMRILDLKREVNELLGKTDQPPRYTSAES